MTVHAVRVVGPRESRQRFDGPLVWTVSKAEDWQRELSPFHLGPVPLYGGRKALCMENAWQFAKVYARHVGADGQILSDYWPWAADGWRRPAVRYPMGKGAKPQFLLWDSARLGYIEARKEVYWRLYRDAVRQTTGYRRLLEMHRQGPVNLFDFDGFDHDALGMSLRDVIAQTARPMGHAFVLKAMLLYGEDIEADAVPHYEPAAATPETLSPAEPQLALFALNDEPASIRRPLAP